MCTANSELVSTSCRSWVKLIVLPAPGLPSAQECGESDARFKRLAHGSCRRKARRLRVNKIVDWQRPRRCPQCKARKVYKHQSYDRYRYDVRFSSGASKRWVTRYRAYRYRCPRCGAVFHDSNREWRSGKWGRDLRALLILFDHRVAPLAECLAGFCETSVGIEYRQEFGKSA